MECSYQRNSALYDMGKLMLYMHNDIFLTDIVGYDQLKFIPLEKNEILGTPLRKSKTKVRNNKQCPTSLNTAVL